MKNEKIIRANFLAWEEKNWDAARAMLGDEFTFTSPNNDDHINIEKYKAKCWPATEIIKKFTLEKIMENGDDAFVLFSVLTKNGKVFRETHYINFSNGKIKTIEVFFGTGHNFNADAV
jgi:ketosteroid isomerase-like protein